MKFFDPTRATHSHFSCSGLSPCGGYLNHQPVDAVDAVDARQFRPDQALLPGIGAPLAVSAVLGPCRLTACTNLADRGGAPMAVLELTRICTEAIAAGQPVPRRRTQLHKG